MELQNTLTTDLRWTPFWNLIPLGGIIYGLYNNLDLSTVQIIYSLIAIGVAILINFLIYRNIRNNAIKKLSGSIYVVDGISLIHILSDNEKVKTILSDIKDVKSYKNYYEIVTDNRKIRISRYVDNCEDLIEELKNNR